MTSNKIIWIMISIIFLFSISFGLEYVEDTYGRNAANGLIFGYVFANLLDSIGSFLATKISDKK